MPHIALLGPPSLLDRCAPSETTDLAVTRIDGRSAAATVAAERPDAVVAFDPSEADWAVLATVELPALIWWQTTPPVWALRPGGALDGGPRRGIAGGSETALGIWRSIPLPVADALFADPPAQPGPATAQATIAVNSTDAEGPASMHRALVALAQSQLLISEPLLPSRGLESGIDYVEARDRDEVRAAVENAVRSPEAFLRMRLRGRRKAELFRSSRVVARLVGDLLLELDLAAVAR